MKRTIILTALLGLLCIPSAVAQEESAKKEFLPQKGEFSIGFDLNPVINFMGNVFNNTSDQTLGEVGGQPTSVISTAAITQPTVSLVGRYMLTKDLAVRANVGMMIKRNKTNQYVVDDAAAAKDPLATDKVVDSKRVSERGGSIAVALEKRLGKRRVQGVFSAGLVYGFATSSTKYGYGNAVTEINQQPSIASGSYTSISTAMPSARITRDYVDGAHSFGLATSAGVECFIAPKISIGLEVNLIAVYGTTTGEAAQYEGYNTYKNSVTTHTELVSPRSSSFTFGTENIGGNLGMNFYF